MSNIEEAWAEVVRYVTLCCDEETAGLRCSYRLFIRNVVAGNFGFLNLLKQLNSHTPTGFLKVSSS